MKLSPTVTTLRAKHAALTRFGRDEDAAIVRRDLAIARLEDVIADVLATYRPTLDQRDRLAALLNANGDSDDHDYDEGRRPHPTAGPIAA